MQTSDTIQAGLILGCGVVTSGAGAALLVGGRQTPRPAVEGVLGVALSGIGLTVVGTWMLLFLVAVLAELLRRRGPSPMAALASACTPALMRRLAVALLGVNLLAVPAVAQAAAHGSEGGAAQALTATAAHGDTERVADLRASVDGPWFLERAARADADGRDPRRGEERPAPAPGSGAPGFKAPDPAGPVSPAWKPEPMPVEGGPLLRGESRTVLEAEEAVVAPGDSLWSIVAARLGPLASAADIAETWPLWYHANRAVIGDDPSFLLPGTVLQAPPA
ncbi:LysM peptidoglycan-binding domain-containing protein [Arthrobacter sp. TMS2-4]